MSNGIRRYAPDQDWFADARDLEVRAVMGDLRLDPRKDSPDERHGAGRSVQLTINGEYIVLTEAQVLDLIGVLSKRVGCADNFSATADLDEYTVLPDGTKAMEETSW